MPKVAGKSVSISPWNTKMLAQRLWYLGLSSDRSTSCLAHHARAEHLPFVCKWWAYCNLIGQDSFRVTPSNTPANIDWTRLTLIVYRAAL